MNFTPEQIGSTTNIILISLFVIAIVFGLIFAILSFAQGVFRTTSRVVVFTTLVIIAACTLEPFSRLIGSIPLDFLGIKTIILHSPTTALDYYAPVTTVSGTTTAVVKGYYLLYGIVGKPEIASEYALALAATVVKTITFAIDMILIMSLGFIAEIILWYTCIKRIVPKMVRRRVKWRVFSTLEGITLFMVSTFLMIAPFSSIANSINGAYQKYNKEDGTAAIQTVDSFISTYNDSLIAKAFMNWTVGDDGLTLDARVMNYLTQATLNDTAVGISDTVYSISSVVSIFSNTLEKTKDGATVIDYSAVASTETIMQLFDCLRDSNLITTILPIAAEMAMNKDLFDSFMKDFDPRLINISDVDWINEIDNVETMVLDIANSGILDTFIDEEGGFINTADVSTQTLIESCLTNEAFNKVEHALSTIDNSTLLSRAIPSLIAWLGQQNETVAKFFPTTWDELNDIEWGFELSTLLECIHDMYLINPEIINALLSLTSSSGGSEPETDPTPDPSEIRRDGGEPDGEDPTGGEEPKDPNAIAEIVNLIMKDIDSYKIIFVGETDGNNQLLNVDTHGRTIVYENGKKISGRKYCLFDTFLSKYLIVGALKGLPNNIYSADGTDPNEEISNIVDDITSGSWIKNCKEEFNAVFYTLSAFKDYPDTVSSLLNGDSIIPDGETISDIDPNLVKCFSKALPRMDKSKLLSSIVFPTIKEIILSDDVVSQLENVHINKDLIDIGFEKAKESNTVGRELAKLIRAITKLPSILSSLTDATTTAEKISNIGDNAENIAYCLDALYSCRIINPSVDEQIVDGGVTYRINENYFNLLDYVFGSSLSINGMSFKEEEMLPNMIWENSKNEEGEFFRDRHGNAIYTGENGAIANVLKVIADSNIMAALDDPNFFTDNAKLALLAKADGYNLPGILKAVDSSKLFSATMGDFLDATLVDLNITGQADVTFNNVTNWEDEGVKLGKVLTEIGKAEVQLSSLELTSIKDIVGFNNMLHALADSNIFIKKDDGSFLFGDWLFTKLISDSEGLDNVFGGSLVKDPDHSIWNSDWENYVDYVTPPAGKDDYRIIYNDLHALKKNEWSSSEYNYDFNTSNYVGTEFEHYYDNENFYTAYLDTLREDELGHLCELVYWSQKALAISGTSIINISSEVFNNVLDSINRTKCLRIGVYNIFEIVKDVMRNDPTASGYFDLEPAYSTYLINCDRGMSLFDESYVDRQKEINYLEDVVATYRMMTAKDILDPVTGVFTTEHIDAEFSEQMKHSVKGLNESLVFHKKGSILRVEGSNEYYPTAFQNMVSAFFLKTDFRQIVYNENNPKDIYQANISHLYEPSVESKIDYIMQTQFDWVDANDSIKVASQRAEIDRIFEVINCIVGGPRSNGGDNYVGLKRFDTDLQKRVTTFSFTDFDIGYAPNVAAIKEILTVLNNTETLYDAVPNSVYLCLTGSGIVTQFSSLDKIHFEDANLFYHYFDRSNTQGVADFNWNAKFTDGTDLGSSEDTSDISLITNLLREASYYASESPADHNKSIITAFENFGNLNSTNIDSLEDFLMNMVGSKVFHSAGPSKTIDPATGNVVLAKVNGKTVFQETIEQFLSGEHIAQNIYNSSNPKDAGITIEEKIENIATTVFSHDPSQVFVQEAEISYLCNFLRDALEIFKTTNITTLDLNGNTINGDQAVVLLSTMNDSQCLRDCVPNILYRTFATESFADFGSSIDFTTAEPFYIYTRDSSTPNYNAKYPQNELNTFGALLNAYKEFSMVTDGENITDLHVIKALVDNGYLYDLLSNLHDSEMLHMYNSRNAQDTRLTVFEQAMYYFTMESGLGEYTYGSTDAQAKVIANIENVTYLEQTNSVNATGYHNKWNAGSGSDELRAFVDFIKEGQKFLGENGTLDFNMIGFGVKDPASVGSLMKALNKVDFLSEALPVFIKEGFHEIGLDVLTTYNDVDYAYYNLSQYEFGGENLDDGVYEIDYIVDALENLYIRTNHISSLHYANLQNIVEFAQYSEDFNGIMELLQLGRIFNTNLDGNYNVMNSVEGVNISGRGLMLYGVLNSASADPSEAAHLASYITGTDKVEKVATLSKIFTFTTGYDYLKESVGLHTISRYSGCIDNTVLNLNNFASVSGIGNELKIMLESCYNVNGTNGRSYFASEIMSGLLDELVAKECVKASISPAPILYGPATIGTDCANIVETAYSSLNKLEGDSVEDIIVTYQMIGSAGTSKQPTKAAFMNQMSKLDSGAVFAKVVWNAEINDNCGGTYDAFAPGFSFYAVSDPIATLLGIN